MLQFDEKGFLLPYNCFRSSLDDIKTHLVDSLKSNTRQTLFNNLIRYIENIKYLLPGSSLTLWIDGSFATKKAEPKDIDIVIFLNQEQIATLGSQIAQFRMPHSMLNYGMDAYIVEVFDEGSRFQSFTLRNKAYWNSLFTRSKVTRGGIKYPKGFLEIIH